LIENWGKLIEKGQIWELVKEILSFTLFKLGSTPVTLADILMFLAIFVLFLFVSQMLAKLLRNKIFARFDMDEGTLYNLERLLRYTFSFLGAIVAFQIVGINLSSLAVIFGLLSVGIGFGLQNITSNFVSGLILLFERPISIGDRITVGDTEGDVVAINMRSTTIRTLSNITIIVPNSEFVSKQVTNWSYGDRKVRLDIGVGVSYDSDLDTVLRCLEEVADENRKVLKSPAPLVHLNEFGDSSWNMVLRCWIPDPKQHFIIRSALNCAIVRKFRDNGVEIPFPQRDLHVRSSVPLPVSQQEGNPEV
jgi:small-conductance mechanosensitive channel